MAKIIGFCGKARHGKDTAAEQYGKRYLIDTPHQRLSFGDGVKRVCAALYQVPLGNFYTKKEEMSEFWGIRHRDMLQRVGTEVARTLDPDHWVKYLSLKMQDIPDTIRLVMITDVRFDNEAQWILDQGGLVLQIERPIESELTGEQQQHASEAGISPELLTARLINNETPEMLGDLVEAAVASFKLDF